MNALSAMLVVIGLVLAAIFGFLLAGGRYHVTVLPGRGEFDQTIYEITGSPVQSATAAMRASDMEVVEAPEPQAPPKTIQIPQNAR